MIAVSCPAGPDAPANRFPALAGADPHGVVVPFRCHGGILLREVRVTDYSPCYCRWLHGDCQRRSPGVAAADYQRLRFRRTPAARTREGPRGRPLDVQNGSISRQDSSMASRHGQPTLLDFFAASRPSVAWARSTLDAHQLRSRRARCCSCTTAVRRPALRPVVDRLPRWEWQRAQRASVRAIPCGGSSTISTASRETASVKLGQPVP